jgi:hypothetical protein
MEVDLIAVNKVFSEILKEKFFMLSTGTVDATITPRFRTMSHFL